MLEEREHGVGARLGQRPEGVLLQRRPVKLPQLHGAHVCREEWLPELHGRDGVLERDVDVLTGYTYRMSVSGLGHTASEEHSEMLLLRQHWEQCK